MSAETPDSMPDSNRGSDTIEIFYTPPNTIEPSLTSTEGDLIVPVAVTTGDALFPVESPARDTIALVPPTAGDAILSVPPAAPGSHDSTFSQWPLPRGLNLNPRHSDSPPAYELREIPPIPLSSSELASDRDPLPPPESFELEFYKPRRNWKNWLIAIIIFLGVIVIVVPISLLILDAKKERIASAEREGLNASKLSAVERTTVQVSTQRKVTLDPTTLTKTHLQTQVQTQLSTRREMSILMSTAVSTQVSVAVSILPTTLIKVSTKTELSTERKVEVSIAPTQTVVPTVTSTSTLAPQTSFQVSLTTITQLSTTTIQASGTFTPQKSATIPSSTVSHCKSLLSDICSQEISIPSLNHPSTHDEGGPNPDFENCKAMFKVFYCNLKQLVELGNARVDWATGDGPVCAGMKNFCDG